MRPALDYLYISQFYAGGRVLRRNETTQRNHGRDCESDCGKETKDILQPHQGGVHAVCVFEREALRVRMRGRATTCG